ncbi:hypothetical protein RUM44_010891 [Polyplax serrata]|uniref:peptidylglycine monooxygenase n=1 Tax=Polyplax serrata TaxID=468196 RepID=A0ABR1ANG5_POLSC
MATAHHILLYGCTTPGSNKPVWDCGEMAKHDNDVETESPCSDGLQIIYAWAKDAPKLELPEGVGFKVGKNSPIKYLVLQVHYAHMEQFKGGKTDNSGVFLEYTERPLNKLAGVLLLGTKGFIPPGKKTEHMETFCTIREDKVIYPFAYRTHTHGLGLVVSGYRVVPDEFGIDQWILLGKRNPQTPQMFYPVQNTSPIKQGDMVAARCTMKSKKDRYTYTGATNDDEMCNFYLMYYIDHGDPLDMKYCFSDGPPYFYWNKAQELNNIPDKEASQL